MVGAGLRPPGHQRAGPWPVLHEPLQHVLAPPLPVPQEGPAGKRGHWAAAPSLRGKGRKGHIPEAGRKGAEKAWFSPPAFSVVRHCPIVLKGTWGETQS